MKHLTLFSQEFLIDNIQDFFNSRFPEATSKLNKAGICRAISLCYINQLFFNEDRGESFLTMLLELSKTSIPFIRNGKKMAATYLDDLYTEIETLKNSLQDPQTEPGKLDELKALLRKKHEQLAFIENFFLFYAFYNGGNLQKLSFYSFKEDSRDPLAGLKRYAELGLQLSTKEQVARVFNQQDPLCPFTQGGIYEIDTINHSMLVWFDENKNQLKLFDPNLGWLLMDKITPTELDSSLFFSSLLPLYKDPSRAEWNINIRAFKPIENRVNPPAFKVEVTQERSVVEKFRSAYEAAAAESQEMIRNREKPDLVMWAINNEHLEILIDFIKNKDVEASLNVKDEYGIKEPLLCWAAQKGHLDVIQALIDAGADIDLVSEYKRTPLYWAAQNGHVEIVTALLAAGADVNLKHRLGETPLIRAAENGHTDTVKALLAAGADINLTKKYDGYTPLFLAAQNGHLEIVKELLAAGAHVNHQDSDGYTPLFFATERSHTEIVTALLGSGAKLSFIGAVRLGLTEMVQQFLTEGPDINHKDSDGSTLLSWAAKKGHVEIVTALLAAGAEANLVDKNGKTPLSWAAQSGHTKVVQELLTAGADVNLANHVADTPLTYAAHSGHTEVVKELLTAGADVNLANAVYTPLISAADSGHTEVVKKLLASGADVNLAGQYGGYGDTPLSKAAENGHTKTVKALIGAGADINHQDEDGRTPLSLAARRGHTETVRALLEASADVNPADKNSETPLSFAASNGHTAIVNLLKEEASSQKGLRASLYEMRAHDDEICERLNRLHTLDLSSTENGDHQLLFHMAKRGALKSFDFLMERSVIPDDDMNRWESAFNLPGDDIDRRDKEGHTALYHAVKEGQVEMVEHILNTYRPNLTLKNNDYETLLALQLKDHPIVTLLGQYNASLLTKLWSRAVLFFSTSKNNKSASSHHEDRPKSP